MSEIPPWPHKPAPPERRQIVPPMPLLWRGLVLAGAGLVVLRLGVGPLLRGRAWGLLAAPCGLAVGALALWSAAIHLTGGEGFDDHEFV